LAERDSNLDPGRSDGDLRRDDSDFDSRDSVTQVASQSSSESELAALDRRVREAEEAIHALRKRRIDPSGGWYEAPLTDELRGQIAGLLRERLVALRRKEQILQRGCSI
jgi:hypothetical protein